MFDVSRTGGYAARTRETAAQAEAPAAVLAELADVADRLTALFSVATVHAGRCAGPSCGAPLTDAHLSPSGARHCRRCRVGWVMVEDEQHRVRAVAEPWPAEATTGEVVSG